MKEFFKSRSYDMVRMFLNQFAVALFGCVLALASGRAGNAGMRNAASIFSIIFYLFLLYVMTWEIGFKDKVSTDHGRKPKRVFTGALISLCANLINFLFAICVSLATFFNGKFFEAIGAFGSLAGLVIEGMYTGLLANKVGGAALNSYWWVWFLLPLPAIIVCGVAYNLGLRDIRFSKLFNVQLPESDRDVKRK